MARENGFTLIELMVVVAIMAVLSAVAVAAYQDSATRTQAAEALTMMAAAKTSVAEYHATHGTVPVGRSEAGMTANANDTAGQFVQAVDINNGEIIATFGHNVSAKIAGSTLVLTPYEQVDGSIAWQCSSEAHGAPPPGAPLSGPTAGTIRSRFAPSQCR